MNAFSEKLRSTTEGLNKIYKPEIYKLNKEADRAAFNTLIESERVSFLFDRIHDQLRELVKSKYPAKRLHEDEYENLIQAHLQGADIFEYGVWVFYPWAGRLVHMLDKEEFILMRTNRNQYKITSQEQQRLATKKIGIIGLSVGQSIAVTLAMERGFGELRLADFDTIDLSNLNRIRTGVHNLGVNKTYVAAREIAEIDPFLEVNCFNEGITEENIDVFLTGNGKLDLLIDECDGLDIKIQCRYAARKYGIPVLMDTSDRGMLDIERFDLEPERPVLHGLIGDLDPASLTTLSNEDKVPIVLQIAGGTNISKRGRASMLEVSQSISTWPQLATSVILGGAVGADVSRRILLDQFKSSGRYYIDLEELVADAATYGEEHRRILANPFRPLSKEEVDNMVTAAEQRYNGDNVAEPSPSEVQVSAIVEAGTLAPSTGNDQPWKWAYKNGVLYLFHDRFYSFSFGDYKNIASFLTFGAVCENIVQKAAELNFKAAVQLFPLTDKSPLIASFTFSEMHGTQYEPYVDGGLANFIAARCTNRNLAERKEISSEVLAGLKDAAESVDGAELKFLTKPGSIKEVGKIIAACDRMRLLNEEGHYDFVHREMRWTPEAALSTKDGIDVRTLGLSTGQLSALEIIKDYSVIDFVGKIKGGGLFEAATQRSVNLSSAIALITMPSLTPENYINGGRAFERMWLMAEKHGLAVHPVISPLYFFPRLILGNGEGLAEHDIEELKTLRIRFKELFQIEDGLAEVFLVKLAYAPKPEIKLLRKPVKDVLYFYN